MKLTIELVPSTCWYNNLRKYMSKAEWDRLRRSVYAEYGHRCAVCGASGMMICHEIWRYDDENHIQALMGFTALCSMCDHVKHIGFAGILAKQGKLDFNKVVEHFMKVNECDKAAFEAHYQDAFAQWRARSQYQWTTDLGEYSHLIKKNKASQNFL